MIPFSIKCIIFSICLRAKSHSVANISPSISQPYIISSHPFEAKSHSAADMVANFSTLRCIVSLSSCSFLRLMIYYTFRHTESVSTSND